MAVRPIIFSSVMIRALLDGRKTMTRRLLKPQPPLAPHHEPVRFETRNADKSYWLWMVCTDRPTYQFAVGDRKATFLVGDRLWVRETWADVNSAEGPALLYRADSAVRPWEDWCIERGPDYGAGPSMNYDRYPGNYTMWWSDLLDGAPDHSWRSSIHMPRWASRLTLIVTNVKVERLQEISSADAIAEGIPPQANSQTIDCDTPDPRWHFASLWDSLHRPGAWEANPWVVALRFTVHRCNVDEMEREE